MERIFGFAGDLVDLVDVDDAHLPSIDVVIGGGDELEQDVLDVLAHVSGLGDAVASAMAKGTSSMRASVWAKSVLPQPVGPSSKMLLLAKLDLVIFGTQAQGNALVVIVDGDGERLLGILLADDVLGQLGMNLDGRR